MLVLSGGMHSGIGGRAHHCKKPSITPRGQIRSRWDESRVFFCERLRRHPRRKTVRMTR